MCGAGVPDHRCGADDQKSAQITIAHLRYAAETVFAAGGVLARNQAEKGRELATGLEDGGIRHAGCQGCCSDDADPGDSLETLTGLVGAVPDPELAFELADLAGEGVELSSQTFESGVGDLR